MKRLTILSPGDPRLPLAAVYAAYFLHVGVAVPFLPTWVAALGYGPVTLGLLLAMGPVAKAAAPWTWGAWADRTHRRRALLAATAAGAALACAALAAAGPRPVPFFLAMVLYAAMLAPVLPYVEATALEQVGAGRCAYGPVRLWGSLSFIVASAGYGMVTDRLSPAAGLAIAAAPLLATAALAPALPPARTREPAGLDGTRPAGLSGGLAPFLLACALMQAGHAPYYAFYSLRLESLGYSGTWIGVLWALAVVIEVLVLARADALLDLFGTAAVLRASLLAAAFRWAVIGTASSPWLLVPVQALHAMTYAAFHVAAVREMHVRMGRTRPATGMALFSGLTYGLGIFAGTLASGFLAGRIGIGPLFLLASVLSLLAVPLVRPR